MKKLLTFLAVIAMTITCFSQQQVFTVTPVPTSYCENTSITLNFYKIGSPSPATGFSYRVYISSSAPFWTGTAVGVSFSPDSIDGSNFHWLKKYSASAPGTMTVTIPSGFIGTPYISVSLVSSGSPTGSNSPSAGQQITVSSSAIATPTITIVGSQLICNGSSATLTSSSASSYLWSPGGATTSSIVVSPTITQNYSVSISNTCGSATDSKIINVIATPTASITPGFNQTICQGNNMTLTASGGTSYVWHGGSNATSSSIIVSSSNSFYAVVSNGCPAEDDTTATLSVTVNSTPTVSVSMVNDSVCQGDSVLFIASSNSGSFIWNTGETTSMLYVKDSMLHSVIVVDNGCVSLPTTNSIVVLGSAFADAGNDVTITSGSTVLGGSSVATSYSWSPSTGLSSTTVSNPTASPTVTTTYSLIVMNDCGQSIDLVTVTVASTTTAVWNIQKDIVTLRTYPNPSSSDLFVELPEGLLGQTFDITICNVLGAQVLSKKYSDNETIKLDISQFQQGTYMLSINSDKTHYTSMFVKIQ